MPELQRQSGGLDINIEDGVDFTLPVVYKVDGSIIDVTAYSATFELRDASGHASALLSLTESAGITVGNANGRFDIAIADTQAVFGNRKMVYDLTITSGAGVVTRLLRGECQSKAKGD